MGGPNKLLLELDGETLVRRVAETALAAGLDPVVVVVGHAAAAVQTELGGLTLSFAENRQPEDGLSSSLRIGIDALSREAPGASGAVVLLGDMPWVRREDVTALLAAFDPDAGREICVPSHADRRGNPVLWSARFFGEMMQLKGDLGARELMDLHVDSVHEVTVDGTGVLRDVDTPEALQAGGDAEP